MKKVRRSVTITSMKKLSGGESGNVLLIPVIALTVLFIGAAVFAVWAFGGRQDYKNHSDAKVASAVAANKEVVQAADAKQFAEAAKNPLKTYTGPDAYGSVKVTYPKTWSAYVDTTGSSTPLDAYFHVDYVPSTQSKQPYNLRVQVVANNYSNQLSQFTSLAKLGKVTVAPYSLPKVPKAAGSVLTGQVFPGNQAANGTLIMLPLRDKTLKVWTESPTYLADFNTYILPNLSFIP